MGHVRLPVAVCAAVAEVLTGSHATLDALFEAAGAPGPPPGLSHHGKWKTWLIRIGNNPEVDGLAIVGNIIEEFMDLPPKPLPRSEWRNQDVDPLLEWKQQRDRLESVLGEHGFQYFRGGRVIPKGDHYSVAVSPATAASIPVDVRKPANVEELLETLIRGLPRAMHPLTHRRRGAVPLTFDIEWDIQDLLHSQLRPWIKDIRPEECTPSYAGSSTRMDFLLPAHRLVIETKRVRDKAHATRIGDELIVDIEHYRRHALCDRFWCVVYDPMRLLQNPACLDDLQGIRRLPDGHIEVKLCVVSG